MPGLTTAGLNAALAGIAAEATHFSLHTADPGATGADEYSGGTYARQAANFGTPAIGEMPLDAPVEFDGVAEANVTYMGIWAGSTFLGGKELDGDTEFNSEGKFVLTTDTKIIIENIASP